jgi:hypothetical protein
METEIVSSLVDHANTLQEVVAGMLDLRGQESDTLRRFLNTLEDEDFRFLMQCDCCGKRIYLELRYAL